MTQPVLSWRTKLPRKNHANRASAFVHPVFSFALLRRNFLLAFPLAIGQTVHLRQAVMSIHPQPGGPRLRRHARTERRSREAFTLIEMLVVITIIALLAAMLLPVLAQAKEAGKKINCLSNLKQLQLCWQMYTDDNAGALPPNDSIEIETKGTYMGQGQISWCEGDAATNADPTFIQAGLLFPYNSSIAIYHCPADISAIVDANGNPLPQLRLRSYNMSQSVNGLGMLTDPDYDNLPVDAFAPCFEKLSAITNPPPSRLFVFIDENEGTLQDCQFGYAMPNNYAGYWFDMPSNRHDQGGNLSFADGHVEYWRWAVPMLDILPPDQIGQQVSTGQWPDYLRIGNAMRIVPFDWQAN